MRESPGIFGFRGLFRGCQPAEMLFARLLWGDALRPLAKRGGWMPERAKARKVFSSRSLAAQVSWAEPCSHRAVTPLFGLLLRKTAGRSKEWQIAKIRDFRRFRTPPKERLSLFALREASHFGPFSALKTGNSNERVTIPPQSLRSASWYVHAEPLRT